MDMCDERKGEGDECQDAGYDMYNEDIRKTISSRRRKRKIVVGASAWALARLLSS